MRKTVAVDVDGVLASWKDGWKGVEHFGEPVPGAVEFTHKLAEVADILIFTTRSNPDVSRMAPSLVRNLVRDWLDQHGFRYHDIWIGVGKPIAAAFVDDCAIRCRPEEHGRCAFDGAMKQVMAACAAPAPPGCSLNHAVTELPA